MNARLPDRSADFGLNPGYAVEVGNICLDPRAHIAGLAAGEGFALVRFASAEPIAQVAEAALAAHTEGRLDGLNWMTEEWLGRATDPRTFLAGARTVILLALPYARAPQPPEDGVARGRVAAYAAGRDYHRIFEKKIRRLAKTIRDEIGADARPTVDYGPLLERPLAAASGMGWLGKSTMLLAPGFGPWVLLGAIATTLDLSPGEPLRKSCGTCTRCITACPTGAISPDGGAVDARLCISYHTIENRGPIPRELRAKFGGWVFGCDACLDSCPVGAHSTATHPDLAPSSLDNVYPPLAELLGLDEAGFLERFRGRPIMRAKRDGMARNACIALGNTGRAEDFATLGRALADASPLVRGHAAWAVARLATRLGGELVARAREALEGAIQAEADPFVLEELALALAELAKGNEKEHATS